MCLDHKKIQPLSVLTWMAVYEFVDGCVCIEIKNIQTIDRWLGCVCVCVCVCVCIVHHNIPTTPGCVCVYVCVCVYSTPQHTNYTWVPRLGVCVCVCVRLCFSPSHTYYHYMGVCVCLSLCVS